MSRPTSNDASVLAGQCLCGAVQYEVADAFLYAANCHKPCGSLLYSLVRDGAYVHVTLGTPLNAPAGPA